MKDIFDIVQEIVSGEDLEEWHGTLKEYMPLVVESPELNDLAHTRIWRMVESKGVTFEEEDENKKNPHYKFFEKELFGIDETIKRIMEYFKSAAAGSDVSRRILLLWGPPSSAKSEFTIQLKKGLEAFSRSKEGRIFAIDGCPMHENPLNAIPKSARKRIQEEYGIVINGHLCPRCAHVLNLPEFEGGYGGDFWKIPVKRIFLSEINRIGVGTFQPGDQRSQSQSELVGSVNFAKLEDYGVESHPMAYNFDGELNVSNRGLMEFIEMLKVDSKFRHILLTLAQEKMIKTERFPLIYADEVVLGHTNETEFTKFLADPKEEALHDRLWVVPCPYNLILDDEVRIYEKLINNTPGFKGIHIAPHTLKVAAMFAILSRLEEPKNRSISLLQKMHLYNGEEVDGFTKQTIKELRESTDREGFEGISPRYIINRIASCFSKYGVTSVTPIQVLRSIEEGFNTNAKFSKDDQEHLRNLISTCIEEYSKDATNDVQKAFFVNFEFEIKNLIKNYLDNVEAYLDNSKYENEWGDFVEPDEKLMRSIEEKVEVTSTGKDSFREEVFRKMVRAKDENGDYDYKSHPKLRRALEKQLFDERKDVIRLTVSSRNPDPESLKKINEVVKVLCDDHGYNEESANEILRYVSHVMSKSQ